MCVRAPTLPLARPHTHAHESDTNSHSRKTRKLQVYLPPKRACARSPVWVCVCVWENLPVWLCRRNTTPEHKWTMGICLDTGNSFCIFYILHVFMSSCFHLHYHIKKWFSARISTHHASVWHMLYAVLKWYGCVCNVHSWYVHVLFSLPSLVLGQCLFSACKWGSETE